ncbi:ATP-binding cassette domain-containing protein, partial [Nonomuraea sp. NPDC055795]
MTTLTERPPAVRGLAFAVEGLTLGYGRAPVLRELDLAIRPGEVLAVAGASGSGKSTLLRALAGLLAPAAGRVLADGVVVAATSADRAMVFQDDGLLPWRTVRRNVELPLALRKVPRSCWRWPTRATRCPPARSPTSSRRTAAASTSS